MVLDEMKKVAEENGVELTEDMLDAIAGGRYSYEEWEKMTDDERIAAQLASVMARAQNQPCALD
ncbi:MAG: hypothetical protein IJJ41_08545 [Clostridia bacterium]|nr:hypothetical protein [Clostridia bacterium]